MTLLVEMKWGLDSHSTQERFQTKKINWNKDYLAPTIFEKEHVQQCFQNETTLSYFYYENYLCIYWSWILSYDIAAHETFLYWPNLKVTRNKILIICILQNSSLTLAITIMHKSSSQICPLARKIFFHNYLCSVRYNWKCKWLCL